MLQKVEIGLINNTISTIKNNPTSAAVASLKRTLRERWREVVEELHAARAPNIFLMTADEDISNAHVQQICDHYRIHLVVWEHLKKNKFSSNPLVLSYSNWASERIPILESFWSSQRPSNRGN